MKRLLCPVIALSALCLLSSPAWSKEAPDTSLSRDYVGATVAVQSVLLFGKGRWRSAFDDYQDFTAYRLHYGRHVTDKWRLTAGLSFARHLPQEIIFSYFGYRQNITALGLPFGAEFGFVNRKKRVQPYVFAGITPAIGFVKDVRLTCYRASCLEEKTEHHTAFLLSASLGAGSRLRIGRRWEAQGAAMLSSYILQAAQTGPDLFALPPPDYDVSFFKTLVGVQVGVNYALGK